MRNPIEYISHIFCPVLLAALMVLAPAQGSAQEPEATVCQAAAADSVALPDSVVPPRPHPDIPEPAAVGIIVRDLATGEDIAFRNPDTLLVPASILKCVTSACALLDNKADMRFVTTAFTRGAVSDRQLWGDLVIVASGDPTTDSPYFPANAAFADSVAANMATLGIDSIRGQIMFDTSLVPGGGPSTHWLSDDYKWDYGAGHFAINYKGNRLPPDRAMPDPPGYFYDALENALLADSITVLGEDIEVTGAPRELYRRYSPPARDIMRSMMVRSDNMFAEAMLRSLAPGDNVEAAIVRERQLLGRLGISTGNISINDGSGLARDNRVTPRFMADVLQAMARDPRSGDYTALFPKAGVEGTVRKVLKDTPLAGKLLLKSGSMRGVQCYAGYKTDDCGIPTHAVVIIVNRFTCPRATVVSEAEAFLKETFLPVSEDNSTTEEQ